MDSNIKVGVLQGEKRYFLKYGIFQSMYTMLAKVEEATVAMKAVEGYAVRMYPF